MKKLVLSMLACSVLSANATIIQWTGANDAGEVINPTPISDAVSGDGRFTGAVNKVRYNNNTVSFSDDVVNLFVVIDINTDKFYISTSNTEVAANAVLSADFDFDITADNMTIATGNIRNVAINNSSLASDALAEFENSVKVYGPNAAYSFSFWDGLGGGQIATVPEPGSLGLMGLGILGIGLAVRRRRKA